MREVEQDDGCCEVEVRDAGGVKHELKLHPVTGEVVKKERD